MSQTATTATTASIAGSTTQPDALDRLTPFGWRGGLAVMLLSLAVSFVAFGYFIIYWRNADMDFMVVYNALAMNDGKPQIFFDHPAYWTILSVKYWFKLLHGLGLLDAYSLSAIPSAADLPGFDQAMTAAVRAGRVAALLTAGLLVLAFAGFARMIVRDWRIALLATFAFAFSGGVAIHMRILRSEMIAGSFIAFALMILIAIAREGRNWRPLAMAAAAMLCVLGLENKIQVIILIAALPVLAFSFGSSAAASTPFWRSATAWLAVLASATVAAAALYLAKPIFAAGLDPASINAEGLKPLIAGTFGLYQTALLVFITAAMIAFALIWKVSMAETLTAPFAVVAGAAVGLLGLDLQFETGNAVAVLNPAEKMISFADIMSGSNAGGPGLVSVVIDGALSVLRRYTFVLFSSARPTVFIIWLVIPGIVYAWRKGKHQLALQALLLMLVAFGLDALGVRRGLKSEYFVLTDPLIIIAGALLLDAFSELRFHRWAYAIGMTLMTLHVVVSQAEPVKHVMKRSGPQYICEWNQVYQPLMPMPWCDKPPVRPSIAAPAPG